MTSLNHKKKGIPEGIPCISTVARGQLMMRTGFETVAVPAVMRRM